MGKVVLLNFIYTFTEKIIANASTQYVFANYSLALIFVMSLYKLSAANYLR